MTARQRRSPGHHLRANVTSTVTTTIKTKGTTEVAQSRVVSSPVALRRERRLRELTNEARMILVGALETADIDDLEIAVFSAHRVLGLAVVDLCRNGAIR